MNPQTKKKFGNPSKKTNFLDAKRKRKTNNKQVWTPLHNLFLDPLQKKFGLKKNGIGATIRISREVYYLQYAEFFRTSGWVRFKLITFHNPENT